MAKTKNTFDDLSNHLFEALERLNTADSDELLDEIDRAKAIVGVADKIIDIGNTVINAEKLRVEYGSSVVNLPRLLEGNDNG